MEDSCCYSRKQTVSKVLVLVLHVKPTVTCNVRKCTPSPFIRCNVSEERVYDAIPDPSKIQDDAPEILLTANSAYECVHSGRL